MKIEDKMQYRFTIIREQEIGATGWDEIAKKMNLYLFEQKVWKTEEFFLTEFIVNGFLTTISPVL